MPWFSSFSFPTFLFFSWFYLEFLSLCQSLTAFKQYSSENPFSKDSGTLILSRYARFASEHVFLWSLQFLQFFKIVVLTTFAKVTGNQPVTESFIIKLYAACNFIKKLTPTKMFSCGSCRLFNKTFSQNTFEQQL